ncbi:MAG: exodeoxyribonuclease VII large subunit [Oligoflexia bacterium]|nr:exodeoxyribonuclease VII large subunit [Oligoflexia bacterium]
MSEQLTLGGLNQNQKSNKKAKKEFVQENLKDDLSARLDRLAKTHASLEASESKPVIGLESNAPTETSSALEKPPQPPAPQKEEPKVLTVSDLNKAIKGMLEKAYPLIWVKGEISNFKVPASGHMYFTLKDENAQIRAVMFKGFTQAMKFRPEDGMEVLVRARVTVYEPRGDYQLFCEVMEPVGYGALQIAFEKLKAQLQKEGLFDPKKKKPLPPFPTRIAIVTSPTGAAIRDMINVLSRRFGGTIDVTVIPTAVQGDKAPGEIAAAVNLVSQLGPERFDVAIVGRGGGSLEDLWAFNTEVVARSVAACRIPTISAVGHEVDFTICDFVADLRAPTPSAAAELVVKNKADLQERIRLLTRQLVQQMQKRLHVLKTLAMATSKRLIDPKRRLQDLMLRCDEWSIRLNRATLRYIEDRRTQVQILREKLGSPRQAVEMALERLLGLRQRLDHGVRGALEHGRHRLSALGSLLNGLSPLQVLDRGYAIVKRGQEIVKSARQVKSGDEIQIKLAEGELNSRII